ncbi:hypothetical protein [Rhodococcus sp. T7]|uniref:hypothetical protein n=1 Tax=Rhodococcus sp. T7 TaxID=627444 RepID=UPI001357DC62|nr:hypothetical protein [Rhodococcus sp. T7]KAF0963784.1 hypothetical protein MLGJGCBP_03051 [Rhodococcus sp. T7]
MGWDDFHRRNRATDAVLEYAHRTGQTSLPFAEVPLATTIFENRNDLLLALQAKWSKILAGYLEYELFDDNENSGMNSQYLAELAWKKAVARQPTLRRLLDSNEFHLVKGRWAASAREFASSY